jgi:signal transduction histidine kinase/ActR/RegA family two-component response regulator/HAMP domain-containing protein
MQAIVSRLRRRIWQPLLLILAVALASPLIFSYFLPPSTPNLWLMAAVLILMVVLTGFFLTKRIVAPVVKLATLAEELSPGLLDKASSDSDEISALTQAVSDITSELRDKEITLTGDMERRNEAMQKLSRNLQEQAASFETALNSMDLPICLFESGGSILQVNQRFCQFLGISAARLRGMGLLPVVSELRKHLSAPDKLTAEAEAIYRKPSVPRDASFGMKDGHGSMRIYCVPIFGEMSSLVGVIVTTAESAESAEVDGLKSEFISTVSHELRTPLTAVKGAVGLVLGGAGGQVPGPIRDLLEIAASNTDRLIQLVNDILDIFRMETGKLQLRPAPVGVPEMVGKACAQMQSEAEATGIRMETRVARNLPLAMVDVEQTQQVLEKLISNAIKFSFNGGVVRIGAEPMPDNPKYLLIWVQDHGQGIPAEAQQRIFDKFEQAEAVLTRHHQGSGLGLAICRGVVEGHGGRIWVKSEPRKGSTFYLTLPVAQGPFRQQSAPAASAASPPVSATASGPVPIPSRAPSTRKLVMVVEDDADTRNIISRMLQSIGHFVLEVSTGAQVVELAIRHLPDVIALDMLLPDTSGVEVLKLLKSEAQTRRIPVICLSVSEELASAALAGGAAQFLRKPLDTAALMRGIHAATSQSRGPTGH